MLNGWDRCLAWLQIRRRTSQHVPTRREQFWINEPHRVFVARDGRHERTRTILTAAEMRDLVERMPKSSGRRVDLSTPFVDAMLACCSRRLDDFSSPDQHDRDVDTASGAQQTAVSAAGATARR